MIERQSSAVLLSGLCAEATRQIQFGRGLARCRTSEEAAGTGGRRSGGYGTMRSITGYLAAWGVVLGGASVEAGFIIEFRTNQAGNAAAQFDGDRVGDTAGPFLDPQTGVSATLTTRALYAPISGPVELNTTTVGLGINVVGEGGEESGEFDVDESWTFDWDVPTYFEMIDMRGLGNDEYFVIQSSDWVGLEGISPASAYVNFDADQGRFELWGGEACGEFDLNDLTGGTVLPVGPGTDVLITLDATDDQGYASIERMSWTATPEPSSFVLTLLALAGTVAAISARGRR